MAYKLGGTLVFVASPQIYDFIGYGFEFKQMKDLPEFDDRFIFFINKMEKETFNTLSTNPDYIETLIDHQIARYPSEISKTSYKSIVRTFIELMKGLGGKYVQLHSDLIHIYDFKVTSTLEKTIFDELDINSMRIMIEDIVEKVDSNGAN